MFYHAPTYLLVCKELYAGVGKDTKQRCGVAFEETADAIVSVYIAYRFGEAGPVALVFCEARIASLEEDLNAIEGADYCLCL